MSQNYQTLFGLSTINADNIQADTATITYLAAGNIVVDQDINVTGNIVVGGNSTLNTADITALTLPTGAGLDKILTSDAVGNATWQPPAIATLVGDTSGPSNANVVNTLAGGTIPVTSLVTLTGTQTLSNKTISGNNCTNITNLGTMNIPTGGGTLATVSGTQTLSNKTLTLPIISSISNGGTITFPAGTSTVITTVATQTLLNKTLTAPTISSITNGLATITIPTTTDTLVGKATTDTLTNKTLTLPIISSISNTGTLTLPTSTDTLVGKATTDILTNKTLTLPIISSISNTGTLTLPTSTDTLVGKATTDTLTNKTLTLPIISSISNTGTLTLPTSTDTLVGKATTDTLTNKTLTGTTNNIDANTLRFGSTYAIALAGAAPSTNNILTYNGTNAVWQAPSAAGNLTGDVTSVGLATTLTNAPVIAKVLTGFVSSAGTISATDSILTFANKIVGNLGAPTNLNTVSQIVKRDASGNFSAGTITANLTGTASNVTTNANLTGDITSVGNATTLTNAPVIAKVLTGFSSTTGTVTATDSILTFANKTTGNLSSLVTVVGTPVSTATNNAIAKRDASAGCAFGALSSSTLSSSSVATLNSISCTTNLDVIGNSYFAGTCKAAGTIQSGPFIWSIPTSQGAHMGWNRGVGSSGRTAFMNQQGLGTGGFEWLNYNNSNALTSPNPLMTLDSSGNLVVPGTISSNPIYYSVGFDVMTFFAIGAGTWGRVDFAVVYGTSGIASSNYGHVTVPITGTYRVSLNFSVGSNKQIEFGIRKNGTLISGGSAIWQSQISPLTHYTVNGHAYLSLTAGDDLELWFLSAFTGSMWIGASDNGAGMWVYCPGSTYSVELVH